MDIKTKKQRLREYNKQYVKQRRLTDEAYAEKRRQQSRDYRKMKQHQAYEGLACEILSLMTKYTSTENDNLVIPTELFDELEKLLKSKCRLKRK